MVLRCLVLGMLAAPTARGVEMPQPTPMSSSVFDGSAAVEAMTWKSYQVTIDRAVMAQPRIVGRVTASGGTGNDIVVLVLSEADFINWRNKHDTRALYNSGQVTVADMAAQLPSSGTYYVVFSNLFSALTPKTVTGQIDLKWLRMPTAAEIAAAKADARKNLEEVQAQERLGVIVVVVAFLLVGIGVGGGIAWFAASRKRKGEKETTKPT